MSFTRTIPPLTGIPNDLWEATAIVLQSAFTDMLDGGAADTLFFYTITGGNAATTY